MNVEILNSADEEKYTKFLLSQNNTSIVSSLLFRDFLQKITAPSTPLYFIAKEGNEIVGALPSFVKKGVYGPILNSLPWFGSNPGVVSDNEEAVSLLIESFSSAADWMDCFSSTFIEAPFDSNKHIYEASLGVDSIITERIGTVTKLPKWHDAEDFTTKMLDRIHGKTRNQVRKSYSECWASYCTPEKPLIENPMLDFLANMHRQNMEAIDAPVKEKEFEIIGKWQTGEDCNLYVSRQRETGYVTAALLVAYFNKTVDYWVPVIDPMFRQLNPLHLLIFEAMKDASKRGFKYWNWGGTTIPGMESVLHFKTRFGGQQDTYHYYTKIRKKISSAITKETLQKHYPFFFVVPHSKLINKGCMGGAQAEE